MVEPGLMCVSSAALTLPVDGLPFSLTTASTFLNASMATTTQIRSFESPRLGFLPRSWSRSVSLKYIASIHTRPENTTFSYQESTVENTLWRHRNAVPWLTSATSSMSLREALWHITSAIRMILCNGSFASAKIVPVSALNLHPHSRHRYLLAPLEAFPSSLGRTDPQSGQTGACPHLSSSPSMVLAPYFSKRFRDCATSHSSANCRSSRPLTSAARSRRASTISAPDILHRPNDHLPGCRQTKKEMADWATLFGWNDYMAAVRVPL